MKIIDIIFALVCGWMLNWVVFDFLKGYGIDFGLWRWLLTWILPIICLVCLWLAQLIGRKFLFVYQAAKFVLVGTFADAADIKIFQLLFFLSSLFLPINQLILKGTSFLAATFIKYWGNKHWSFEKFEKEGINKEAVQFFAATLIGLGINVLSFYYFTKIIGPQFQMEFKIWQELSIILAALVTAVWNFTAYKFLVFKK